MGYLSHRSPLQHESSSISSLSPLLMAPIARLPMASQDDATPHPGSCSSGVALAFAAPNRRPWPPLADPSLRRPRLQCTAAASPPGPDPSTRGGGLSAQTPARAATGSRPAPNGSVHDRMKHIYMKHIYLI